MGDLAEYSSDLAVYNPCEQPLVQVDYYVPWNLLGLESGASFFLGGLLVESGIQSTDSVPEAHESYLQHISNI